MLWRITDNKIIHCLSFLVIFFLPIIISSCAYIIKPPTPSKIDDPLTLGSLKRDGYQTIPVLVYHSIVKEPKKITEVSLDSFYEQIKYLHDNGYTAITTKQLLDFLASKSRIPEKSVVLTFDDGYRSIYELVYKVLKEFKSHGILFLYTDAIEKRYPSFMTWEQIKEIKDVFDVHVHTKTHSEHISWKTDGETGEEYKKRLDKELLFPKKLIREKANSEVELLAYPYGKYSENLISLLRDDYGYKGAFTVIGASVAEKKNSEETAIAYGYNGFFTNPFKIRRIQILKNTDLKKFKRRLRTFKKEKVIDKDVIENFNREIKKMDEKNNRT
jgi:peptidoglycan/xylan/chitin deacetylase (PgdA/CDA1 family)